MIAKGNFHSGGVKLAAYLVKGHPGERAELVDMRGFGVTSDLRDAFRIEQIRARDGTKADQPFFHVQIRGANGEGANLTAAQWAEIANRCDKALHSNMCDQPRAASLHINRQTGDRHLHLAYSLVRDGEDGQLYVQKLGLFKNHLKAFAREIEKEFGLTIVSSERRDGDRAKAADRREVEESRRLGTDVRAIRTAILDCLEQSDGGKAFNAALEARGLMLANGDRRDCFVVIDEAGGQHALNKKLTGQTLAATRDRLADLDRSQLPSVEQAQAMQAERHHAPEAVQESRQQPAHDAGGEPRAAAEQAAPAPEKRPLGKTGAQIHAAWNETRNAGDLATSAAAFQQAIEDRGPTLVYVTAEEAHASERARSFAKAIDRQNRALKEGFAVVDERGAVTRIDQRVTGDLWQEIEQRLASIDRASLLTVAEARDVMKEANRAAWADAREQARPASAIEATIADALTSTMTGTEFAAALDEKGLTIARASVADEQALEALRAADIEADTIGDLASGRRFAEITTGELAAVTRQGDVFRLSPQKLDFEDIEQRLADVQTGLPTVVEARALNEIDRERKADEQAQSNADFIASRLEQAALFAGQQELRQTVHAAEHAVHKMFSVPAAAIDTAFDAASGLLGGAAKIVEALGDFLGGLFGGPKLTPQQAHDAAQAAGNEETLHARAYAASVQAKEAEFDDRMHAQTTREQEQDLSFAARYGTPPTREANSGREHDNGRERERER